MGAPTKNRNATRHGLRSASLPKGASYISRATNELRRAVEDAVLDAKGAVDILDAATIQTIVRLERHAMLAQRWLRREHEKMSLAERLKFSAEVGRASAERDKALRSLGIGATGKADLLAEAYRTPLVPVDASGDASTALESKNGKSASHATLAPLNAMDGK